MTKVDDSQILRQVLLRTPTTFGYKEDCCWIDNELAVKGKRLRTEDDDRIWTVVAVYSAKSFQAVDKARDSWRQFAAKLDGH